MGAEAAAGEEAKEAAGEEAGGGGGGEAGDGEGRGGAPAGRRFVLLEKVRAPVSWDAGHVFWVWRCESAPRAELRVTQCPGTKKGACLSAGSTLRVPWAAKAPNP